MNINEIESLLLSLDTPDNIGIANLCVPSCSDSCSTACSKCSDNCSSCTISCSSSEAATCSDSCSNSCAPGCAGAHTVKPCIDACTYSGMREISK